MVSPHFPPDATAGAHRVRLLAPHLAHHGWTPTVVTVDPRDYEGRLDHDLASLVPADLDLVRCRALPAPATRRLGVGDLGLRAFAGLYRACADLASRRPYDALFVTIYPTAPALLGPLLKRRFRLPFVLDYQDPWVGAWGLTTGPGGQPDWKSRWSRRAATLLEPIALRAADAVTAVSRGTFEEVWLRHPELRRPSTVLPIGFDAADVDRLPRHPRPNPHFDPSDGIFHLCSVGTILPLGGETLHALLAAVARLRDTRPALYRRLRLHFLGTSNQADPDAPERVLPLARELGVADRVHETPPRIPYLEALAAQRDASALLLLGSSEPHYTASRLFPALVSRRPLLALYHESSSVISILRGAPASPTIEIVTYGDRERASTRIERIADRLAALLEPREPSRGDADLAYLAEFSASALAQRLAAVLEAAARGGRA